MIYSDRENHASIIEGTRVAIGDTVKFRHNDMTDLERVLAMTRQKYEGALIVADGVFSMSGDIFNFPEAVRLAEKYNCRSTSTMRMRSAFSDRRARVRNITSICRVKPTSSWERFPSLSLLSAASSPEREEVIHYIKHKARPFMFSAAMPPAAAGDRA